MKSLMGNYELLVNVNNNFQYKSVTSSCLSDQIFLTSLVTMIVGLIMALIEVRVDKLHSPTLANTIIVAITNIIFAVDVTLCMYLSDWLYDIICLAITSVLSIPAIVLSFRVRRLSRKQKITIFSIMCVFLYL
ncbi:hypothetical protein KSF78_0008017 [Schistosoma japonicum]|nr:hypothetical protein KSF78_0008017 [Schistosoma japonicum]KAH8873415.1 hypothetical protein KSF78_0008017 [Schistosoma japonicum]